MKKRIVLDVDKEKLISLTEINPYGLIWAEKNGEIAGMIVKDDKGWILRRNRHNLRRAYYCCTCKNLARVGRKVYLC